MDVIPRLLDPSDPSGLAAVGRCRPVGDGSIPAVKVARLGVGNTLAIALNVSVLFATNVDKKFVRTSSAFVLLTEFC
jgi:hypothetical protein